MNVMYTCDNNYIWLAGISMISLFENNRHMRDLSVFLLGENISGDNKEVLNEIACRYDRKITVINVPQIEIPSSLVSSRWPLSAFTRLFSGQLLPDEIHKILYLDCDTVVTGNIELLEQVSFGDNVVLGVKDCVSGVYKQNIGLEKKSLYINAGVILFDMDTFRKIDIHRMIEVYMNKYMNFINYADQDILNGVMKNKIGELPPEYDVMTIDAVYSHKEIMQLRHPTNFYEEVELAEAVNKPKIIHYTTNMLTVRPWFTNTDHPFASEFKKYMQMSPWKDRPLGKMVFNTKESMIVWMVGKLPKGLAHRILGLIHSELKPRVINVRAKMRV